MVVVVVVEVLVDVEVLVLVDWIEITVWTPAPYAAWKRADSDAASVGSLSEMTIDFVEPLVRTTVTCLSAPAAAAKKSAVVNTTAAVAERMVALERGLFISWVILMGAWQVSLPTAAQQCEGSTKKGAGAPMGGCCLRHFHMAEGGFGCAIFARAHTLSK